MNAFSLFIGFGASLGLFSAASQAGPDRRASAVLDAGLAALAAALAGGRAGYVLLNWSHFQAQPVEIPQVWLGGISGPGAVAGGILGQFAASVWLRLRPGELADQLYPLLPPLVVCAWLANWQAGSAYGPLAPGEWWAIPARDETGLIAARIPLQLAGALGSLLLFAAVDLLRPRLKYPGQPAWLAVFGTSLIFCAICFFRADPSPVWGPLRWDALAGIALALGGLVLFLFSPVANRKQPHLDHSRS